MAIVVVVCGINVLQPKANSCANFGIRLHNKKKVK